MSTFVEADDDCFDWM